MGNKKNVAQKNVSCTVAMSIDLNYREEKISRIIKHSTVVNSPDNEPSSSETNTRQGVIMHLKNAAAFKYQTKETFYDSFSEICLTTGERKLREIVLSEGENGKGNEKFI